MAEHIIKMPDIGEGIAEVELVEWHVQPGDRVQEDQVLADVMTDKATVQVPSPVDGTVLSLGGRVGEVMAVGSELIRIGLQGAQAPPEAEPAPVETSRASGDEDARASSQIQANPARKPLASPAVRKHAYDLGVDLQALEGSGPKGRITHVDVEKHLPADNRSTNTASNEENGKQTDGTRTVQVSGLRRRIAEKMQESKRRIPHFTYVEEVDVSELEALREQLNHKWEGPRGKLTLLPFLVRGIVLALADFPQINARYDDEAGVVTEYQPVHLGIATQTAQGLMVPVLQDAQTLDLWSCASAIRQLAEGAREGTSSRKDLTGSTITLTSLGALGGIVSTPIINHPEVAIVGINRIVERPVMRKGVFVARKMMNVSSSFDHRIVDGMQAAQFIQSLRALLECPALLFVN